MPAIGHNPAICAACAPPPKVRVSAAATGARFAQTRAIRMPQKHYAKQYAGRHLGIARQSQNRQEGYQEVQGQHRSEDQDHDSVHAQRGGIGQWQQPASTARPGANTAFDTLAARMIPAEVTNNACRNDGA